MKRIITIFAIIILTVMGLFLTNQAMLLAKSSSAASEAMLTANQLYETGQFTQAVQAYEQLIDQGYGDSTLYYNLGNAYFKQGDYGRAILNYRRAEQLAPRDADIEINLEMARAQVTDNIEEPVGESSGFINNVAGYFEEWFTFNELAIVTLAAWIVFVLLVIVVTSLKKGGVIREATQYAVVVATLVLTVGLVGLGSRMYVENAKPQGIVVAGEVNITSGPGSQYVTEFTLHNGAEVQIVETRANWIRLAVPNSELQGWAPAPAVEAVTGSIS